MTLPQGRGRFAFVLEDNWFSISYTYDSIDLAKRVKIVQVPPDSEAQRWKNTVIDMLKARGAKFPAFIKNIP
ncbi:hypothetical protein [Pseudomonas sp. FW305-70]|uniref:hypothetical protein n=1 Tax=Pseudomonas sp. FW305-70 TaxID=2751342 RepID=UPI000C88532D|nr:hypothetical protein [Pseudomonas sp. FW305-70]PMZ73743.1 hypothetical protein C1X65_17185 [Pseudomonas sp. FW305-70]